MKWPWMTGFGDELADLRVAQMLNRYTHSRSRFENGHQLNLPQGFHAPRLWKGGIQMCIDRVTSDGWPCRTRSLANLNGSEWSVETEKTTWTSWILVAGHTSLLLFGNVWRFSWVTSIRSKGATVHCMKPEFRVLVLHLFSFQSGPWKSLNVLCVNRGM